MFIPLFCFNMFCFEGLLKKEEPSNVEKVEYNDLLNEKLDDIDDEDIDFYIIQDQEEVTQRQLEWNLVNKDYIKLMDEKESQKLNDDSKPGTAPKGVRSFGKLISAVFTNVVSVCSERNDEKAMIQTRWRQTQLVKRLRLHVKPRASH